MHASHLLLFRPNMKRCFPSNIKATLKKIWLHCFPRRLRALQEELRSSLGLLLGWAALNRHHMGTIAFLEKKNDETFLSPPGQKAITPQWGLLMCIRAAPFWCIAVKAKTVAVQGQSGNWWGSFCLHKGSGNMDSLSEWQPKLHHGLLYLLSKRHKEGSFFTPQPGLGTPSPIPSAPSSIECLG